MRELQVAKAAKPVLIIHNYDGNTTMVVERQAEIFRVLNRAKMVGARTLAQTYHRRKEDDKNPKLVRGGIEPDGRHRAGQPRVAARDGAAGRVGGCQSGAVLLHLRKRGHRGSLLASWPRKEKQRRLDANRSEENRYLD